MDEFLPQDKLLVIIGLFQFGIIFLMFLITKLSRRNISTENISSNGATPIIATEALSQANISNLASPTPNPIITESPQSRNNDILDALPTTPEPQIISETLPPIETVYSVNIAPDLFTELMEISNNPAGMVDEAIRWWLRRRNLDSLDTTIDLDRRYRVGMRSNSKRSLQDLWND